MARRRVCVLLVLCLVGNAFCLPLQLRLRRGFRDNELDSNVDDLVASGSENRDRRQDDSSNSLDSPKDDTAMDADSPSKVSIDSSSRPDYAKPVDSDEDDDFDEPAPAPATGGGSNIFSLLRLANALFPSSSGGNILIQHIIREFLTQNQLRFQINRRQDVTDNEIEIDYTDLKPPPFERQEDDSGSEGLSNENGSESRSDDDDSHGDDDNDSGNDGNDSGNDNNDSAKDDEDKNNAAEESIEDNKPNGNDDSKSKQDSNGDSNGNGNGDDDYESDEPPEGDGQGGGILGVLAGLSGGEDGQSDLGSLLATISGIVANLSGDGIDLNALIASGIGLFVGLLSEGEENPGAILASYLLTSLETITGGGSQNNGAFFGTFLSKLIGGTSAGGDPDASSEENGGERPKDSAGFFGSFLMALLGEMSKGSSKASSSSSCSSCHQPWMERIFTLDKEGMLN